eukprot:tig00021537_g22300.t1
MPREGVPALSLAALTGKQSLVSSRWLDSTAQSDARPLSTNRPQSLVPAFSTRRSNPFSPEMYISGGGRVAEVSDIFSMWMIEAKQALKRDAFGSAIVQYTQALRVRPGDQAALLGRFRCHMKIGDLIRARADAEALLAGDKDYIPGLLAMAEVLAALGKVNMAKIYLLRGLKLRPESKALKRGMAAVDQQIAQEHETSRHKGRTLVLSLERELEGRSSSPAPLYDLRGREAYRASTAHARLIRQGLAQQEIRF